MALTVVKYTKTSAGQTTATASPTVYVKSKLPLQQQQQTLQSYNVVKKHVIKLEGGGGGIVINKIPAVIKPATKRLNSSPLAENQQQKSTKYSLQTIASTGSPLTSFQWQQTIGAANTATTSTASASATKSIPSVTIKKEQLGEAFSSLPPNTIIQAKTVPRTVSNTTTTFLQRTPAGTTIKPIGNGGLSTATTLNALTSQGTTVQVRRPTIFIKRDSRTIRNITIEIIEKSPETHLGLHVSRLSLLKNIICATTGVAVTDCYLVLKKLRLNESFPMLADYFEMTLEEVHHVFTKSLVRLARYMRFLLRWSEHKRYAERHRDIPLVYRHKLSNVQSLIECVDTEVNQPENSQYECHNYKFILSLTPNDIISYVSDAFLGTYDDLTIMQTSNFQSVIPKYLTMMCDPGKGIKNKRKSNKQRQRTTSTARTETDSTTDSAEESLDEDIEVEPELKASQPAGAATISADAKQTPAISKVTQARIAVENVPNRTLHIVKNHLKSTCATDLSIPTARVTEPNCRKQIRSAIDSLREFKILQPHGLHEPMIYQYISEILIVTAALTNLNR